MNRAFWRQTTKIPKWLHSLSIFSANWRAVRDLIFYTLTFVVIIVIIVDVGASFIIGTMNQMVFQLLQLFSCNATHIRLNQSLCFVFIRKSINIHWYSHIIHVRETIKLSLHSPLKHTHIRVDLDAWNMP